MLGEEPAVTVEVEDSVLTLAVDGLVELLDEDCALVARLGVVGIYVVKKYGEHLGAGAGDGGAFAAFAGAGDHDDGFAEAHLDAADWVAVAIELREAKDAGEPGPGLGDVAVNQVGQHGIGGDGAVIHNDKHAAGSDSVDSLKTPMTENAGNRSRLTPLWRAVVEIAFIVFLFYSNLLMGEFTGENGVGKSWAFAIRDIFTGTNLMIALVSAGIGYAVFEGLRKKL